MTIPGGIRVKLSLALLVIVGSALFAAYAIIVPSLERRLVDAKLDQQQSDAETLAAIEGNGQVVFRYAEGTNPNGSVADIAGIVNAGGNVLGLMPHPDRSFDPDLGSEDGAILFRSIFASA